MQEDILNSIDGKLNAIVKLLSGNLIQGKNKTEAILTLGMCGIDANTIADIVGTTANAVNARLSEQRKKLKPIEKKPKKSKEDEEWMRLKKSWLKS